MRVDCTRAWNLLLTVSVCGWVSVPAERGAGGRTVRRADGRVRRVAHESGRQDLHGRERRRQVLCPSVGSDSGVGQARPGAASHTVRTAADAAVPTPFPQTASGAMTLNGGGSGAGGSRGGGRERERRRGSTPWGPAPPMHRRSMPVDERDLQAALAPGALAAAAAGTGAQGATLHWPEGSSESLSSAGSDSDESVYKVLLLGAPGVGKSALARIFGGVEDGPEAEVAGEGLGLFKGWEMPGED